MRALLAATAVAAALVLVPIQARLEPLTFAVETQSPSPAAAVQSGQSLHEAGTDAEPAPARVFAGSDSENDPNAIAAAVPSQPAVGGETSADAVCAALDRSASQNNLPLDFFTRLIWQESRFNPFSVSHAGAQGIAQFMPGTARLVGLANPFDPIQALPKSAALLRELRWQFGNLGLAAAAYNAGPKRIDDWLAKGKPLPQETEAYVRIITGRSAQEWISTDADNWIAAPPAPAPCARLAKPVPHRTPPVIAIHQPERPVRAIVVAHRPADRTAAAAHPADTVRCCRPPANGGKAGHPESNVAARDNIRRSPANGAKLAHVDSNVAAHDNRSSAKGVKLAHLESGGATPKSAIPAVKSTIAAPKSIIAAPKSAARPHSISSPSASGATTEASHAPRREQPAAHRKPTPNPRAAARLA
jgi:soluble lytic murein transglycosylase-like protein